MSPLTPSTKQQFFAEELAQLELFRRIFFGPLSCTLYQYVTIYLFDLYLNVATKQITDLSIKDYKSFFFFIFCHIIIFYSGRRRGRRPSCIGCLNTSLLRHLNRLLMVSLHLVTQCHSCGRLPLISTSYSCNIVPGNLDPD